LYLKEKAKKRKRRKKMVCEPQEEKITENSKVVEVWRETFPVRFGSIDKSERLTLDAVFQFFQEAAISHAENIGVGKEDMERAGQAWILSRMTVIADRRPKYRETITLRTWPRGSEKLFVRRNYDIRDSSGIPVVRARSGWLIVDIEKRRPLRPDFLTDKLPMNEGNESLSPDEGGAAAIKECGNLQKTTERKALYTDIDYFGHVNNVRYIQWIEDAVDPALLEKAEKMRLDINYLNEIIGGEVIEILSAQIEDKSPGAWQRAFAVEGRKENGQPAFRAELRLTE
jgi:acyl-ACP thioesterase